MINLILVLILGLIVGAAVVYIYKAKKRGVKCIGCPSAQTCGRQTACSGSCASCGGNCPHHQA